MPFIQVTEIVSQRKRPPERKDVWLDVESIRAFWPVPSAEYEGANCVVRSGGYTWCVEETAGKVALMLEEAEGKQGYQVLAASTQGTRQGVEPQMGVSCSSRENSPAGGQVYYASD